MIIPPASKRHQTSLPEIVRFGIVAVIGLIVDIMMAWGLAQFAGAPLILAAAAGFCCGASVNYILHEYWTFQAGARRLSAGRALRYAASLTATLAVRLISVALLVSMLGREWDLGILISATGISFGVNYLLSRHLVFRRVPGSARLTGEANILNEDTWELPASETAIYAGKVHDHALVIPVINEGERIRNQLARIAAADLPVDVVIADGGSQDGSLDPDHIRTLPVRAVLTKIGPGKLSAQLRMAYAWCLREGYGGIVTVDGNGKDGVEAVTAFVDKLRDGYDYVQGSRYARGGMAENTPLERAIANRLIHAPLLSLAGGHWFTDTTNGFRAYSATYLRHPQVQPFRDVFRRYELLFYLTVRAGQLGLKVTQIPVRRSYPPNSATPTKITGVKGKLDVLGQTVSAALGKYTP